MMDRPLSPITERSSYSSRRSDVHTLDFFPITHPTSLREFSYESEREDGPDEDVDGISVYSQVSSGETIMAARATAAAPFYLGELPPTPSPGRPFPFTSTSPSPGHRTRTSTPTTPRFEGVAPPGGLLPPPRGKRDSAQYSGGFSTPPIPTLTPVKPDSNHRPRQRSQIATYPGGREVINLDLDTDDEGDSDARSFGTATTSGLAGLGAGDNVVRVEMGKTENGAVQGALRGIMEEQDMFMRRFRESAPTPPHSRPNSFCYDPEHPTLHNIPTYSQTENQKSLVPPPIRTRTSSKLVKSPPGSRPGSTPGTPKGGKHAEGDLGAYFPSHSPVGSGSGSPGGYRNKGMDQIAPHKDLTIQDALGLSPPVVPPALTQPPPSAPPSTPAPRAHSPSSILRTHTPPSSKKRSSRIIPHILFSLFSDTATAERKREAGALGDEHTDSKLSGESTGRTRTRSKLAKRKSGVRSENTSPRSDIPISDGLPLGDRLSVGPEVLEATVRLSGTFGVRDDGSDVLPLDPGSPGGMAWGARRWSGSTPSTPAYIPFDQPLARSPGHHQRSESLRTDITTGTAQTFAPDRNRELYTHDAQISTDDLVPIGHGRANVDDLPPISEGSYTGHTSEEHGHSTSNGYGDWPISPRTPELEVRTPELGVSAVTPPYPLPPGHRPVQIIARVLDEMDVGDEATYGYPGAVWREEEESRKRSNSSQRTQVELPVDDPQRMSVSPIVPTSPSRRRLPMTPTRTPTQSVRDSPYLAIPLPTPDGMPAQPRTPEHATRPALPRSPTTSFPPPHTPPIGLPPLPPSLQGLSLAHTPAADLPLLIASHLLSSHAASLMRHSSHARETGDEMFRLAQESLDWGRVLISMASATAQESDQELRQGLAQSPRETAPQGDNEIYGRYDGMPGGQSQNSEELRNRLSPRRDFTVQHHSPDLGSRYLQLPPLHPAHLPPSHTSMSPHVPALNSSTSLTRLNPAHVNSEAEAVDPTLSRTRRADRQRKAESLPPEWFQRVEHLGSSGWAKIHEAEQVWRESMEGEALRLRAGSAMSTRPGDGLPEITVRSETGLSSNADCGAPLQQESRSSGSGSGSGCGSGGDGQGQKISGLGSELGSSRKLVKKPSKRTLKGSKVMARDRGDGSVEVKSSVKGKKKEKERDDEVVKVVEGAVGDGAKGEGGKSRWWKRK